MNTEPEVPRIRQAVNQLTPLERQGTLNQMTQVLG